MRLKSLTGWYLRNERWISSLSLVGGFVVDTLTLRRVDLLWENLWVVALLSIAAICIILINLNENQKDRISAKAYSIIHFWLIITVQFAFGGLLSAFLVFYLMSSTLSSSWPFILVIFLMFIFNELLKKHYTRLVFQTGVLFFSIYSFAIFLVPVILHQIGPGTFMLSGLLSLISLIFFVFCLRYIARERFLESKKPLILTIVGMTILINVLYFTNLIPPIPLSLKDAGVYHSISRVAVGEYVATGEERGFWDYFRSYELFHKVEGQPVYVFSSIFSPTNLNTEVVHEWQYYDASAKKWIITYKIKLSIIGGRGGGFRTYSFSSVNRIGRWRVNVKTLQGQIIGRIKFEIESVEEVPNLITHTLM